ncbi:hypothetical protein H4R99_004316 [Coemansia sp. RSA 1722]|nr:hypothetical protein IWW45_006258 [Coemansia sp. RSA 485]KAJ2597912.1 hypothetical protein H4R99_004316 [Coemansia sp. RSA 1722]KAJ2602948.1 hypothetical protein GGF39_000451 [Coemansia sp. RSA 1721]KAJ2640018.1 hypothetical protein GGF40_000380 [Coemansia sp. RSA 1286]
MSSFFSGLLGRKPADAAPIDEKDANKTDSVVYDTTPRLFPSTDLKTEPTPGPTSEEQKIVDIIDAQRQELLKDLPQEPADDSPRFNADHWLTPQKILLYVRANKGDQEKAIKRLRATLEWHCQYRPHAITPEMMRLEGATGKQYVNGHDRGGRPIIYMFPHNQNTKDAKGHLHWVVYTMEQAIRAMPPGVTKLTIVIDVSRYSMSQSVPLSTAREFLHILEAHYPERLHKALVLSPPTMFVMFYHIVAPFIDPVTKAKIAFVDLAGNKAKSADGPWVDVLDHIAPDQLQSNVGGEWQFKYEQDAYWVELEKSYDGWIRASSSKVITYNSDANQGTAGSDDSQPTEPTQTKNE